MPSLTTTIEDNSPLILYSPEWRSGSSTDNAASLYSQASFTATQAAGAVASFTFNGTGVQIFGSRRDNHGEYQVKVDDTLYPPASGKASAPGLYQQPLFSTTSLSQGLHLVTLTNQEKAFVDIDFITWQTNIGTEGEKIFVNTFQDTDPSFRYLPGDSSWSTNPNNIGSFLGGSGHATITPGASFTYTFQVGEGVSLYGPVSPDGSPYAVQLDEGRMQNFTSNKRFFTPQSLLYHADSLGPGEHRLKLLYQPTTAGQVFAIDYATVFTTSGPSTSQLQSGRGMSSLALGSIVGMVISLALLLGLLGFIAYRRRLRTSERNLEAQHNVKPYADNTRSPDVSTAPYSLGMMNVSPLVTAASQPFILSPAPIRRPSPFHESPSGRPIAPSYNLYSSEGPISDSGYSTFSSSDVHGARRSLFVSNSTSPRTNLVASRKSGVQLPMAAGQSSEGVPEEKLRSNRRIVEGQSQDLGGSSSSALSVSTSTYQDFDGLPPDYYQATEPHRPK